MDTKAHIGNILTTIETLSNYACESCGNWELEDNCNFNAEAFFYVIQTMTKEAKGWLKTIPTSSDK